MSRPKGSKNGTHTEKVPVQYDLCEDEVVKLAGDLIGQFHTHLAPVNMCYIWKNKEITHKGQNVGGTAEKVSDKIKAICGKDFIITLSYPTWQKLPIESRKALLDHELMHCMCLDDDAGNTKYSILPHDFEEFNGILQRYKLWRGELEIMAHVVKNFDKEDKTPEEKEDDLFDS